MSIPLPPVSIRDDSHEGDLLVALQEQLLESLLPALEQSLGESAQGQFDQGRVIEHVRHALIAGFRGLPASKPAPAIDAMDMRLSLLSEDALETQLVREQVAEGASRPNARGLEMLGQRLARASRRDSLRASENPMAPAFIVHALAAALDEADPDARHRIAVLRSVERPLAAALAQAYERCEAMLASGSLPQRPRPAAQPRTPTAAAGRPVAGTGLPADGALFAHMLRLLESRRPVREELQLFDPGTVTPTVPRIGSNELLSILALMQQEAPDSGATMAAAGRESLAERLLRDIAQNARKLGMDGDGLRLGETDEETLGLMAKLFDSLLDGARFDPHARQRIDRLLVPYTRVAVRDRDMFDSREHPAWRLLNTVAEACAGNRGDAPQERELLDRVDRTIDRVVSEFNEDVAIFETLEHELRAYMAQHRKRFELAERRAAQARLGRERLEQARAAAAAEILARRGDRALPAIVAGFLDQHVAHHLSQVILRDGPGSPRHAEAVQAIDDLLAAFDRGQQPQPSAETMPLPRRALEAVLASSGFAGESAALVIDELEEAVSPKPVEAPPVPVVDEIAQAAESETVAPQDAPAMPAPSPADDAERAPPRLAVVGGTDLLDFEADMLARVRQLRVGDWLHLQDASGRMEPAKVSWVSPISSRLLLVNRRGVRVLTASTAELAAMVKLGKARVGNA